MKADACATNWPRAIGLTRARKYRDHCTQHSASYDFICITARARTQYKVSPTNQGQEEATSRANSSSNEGHSTKASHRVGATIKEILLGLWKVVSFLRQECQARSEPQQKQEATTTAYFMWRGGAPFKSCPQDIYSRFSLHCLLQHLPHHLYMPSLETIILRRADGSMLVAASLSDTFKHLELGSEG